MSRLRPSLVFVLAASAFTLLLAAPTSSPAQEPVEEPVESEAAQDDPIGTDYQLGLGLGTGTYTTGITGKLYTDPRSAFQVFVGSLGSFGRYGCTFDCGIAVSASYLNEFADLVDEDPGRLFAGAGGGGFAYSWDGAGFGIHGVLELGWHFREFPLELVLDIRPILGFGDSDFRDDDDLFFDIDGGGAIRYYF